MMIQNIILIEIALIDTGGNNGRIGHIDSGNGFSFDGKGFLYADAIGLSVRFIADGDQIAAQTDTCTFYAL